ncbi:hypothetical protein ACQY0O_006327 [Thecaphora frezii]
MAEPLSGYPFAANIMSGQTASSSSSLAAQSGATASSLGATPSKARKQAQAQRTRLLALSKHLMTRLQYATFKVEHGWAKQSLSEVENLYYRQNQAASLASGVAKANAPTASSSNTSSRDPATPIVASVTSVSSRLFKEATALKRPEADGGDVFGGYGLATPPASGGTHPSSYSSGSKGSGSKGRASSFTPVSPPGAQAPVLGEPFGSKRPSPRDLAPSSVSRTNAAPSSRRSPMATAASSGNGGATSYADFWNRVGSSAGASVSRQSGTASPFPSSDQQQHHQHYQHHQHQLTRGSLAGSKRSVDTAESPIDRSRSASAAAAGGGGGGGGGSPLKRVRMDLSPTKAGEAGGSPLLERGPSFAASDRSRAQGGSAEAGEALSRLGRSDSPTPLSRS